MRLDAYFTESDDKPPFAACTDRLGFDLLGTTKLGVINVCAKEVAAAIMAQPTPNPDALTLEPYLYQSVGGDVIVAIDRTAPPAAAARVGQEVQLIPE